MPSDHCLRVSLIITNSMTGLLGILIFALAMWMRMEKEVRDWVRELGMQQYWTGLYILMAAGLIIVIVSFFGCCGAASENRALLAINQTMTVFSFVLLMFGSSIILAKFIRPSFDYNYLEEQFRMILHERDARQNRFYIFLAYYTTIFVFIAMILELAGAIYLLINGTQTSKITPWLERKFDRLIVDSNYNPQANRILQIIQEKVGCCGSINYQDYDRHRLPISDFCRDVVSGNVYQEGCVEKFSIFIEKRTGWIAGIALFIAALQLMLIGLNVCFWRTLSSAEEYDDERRRDKRPYTGVAQNDY